MISVSVIIPNLHSPIVDQTIESILNQETAHPFEIIVVGMDKFGLVTKYLDRVQFIETEQPIPPGQARNLGVSAAHGNYYVFVDSDCIASPDWLEKHIETHLSTESERIVGGSVTFPHGNFLILTDNVSSFHEYMEHIPVGKKVFLPSINMSISQKSFSFVGGFNLQRASEDTDFCVRAARLGIASYFESGAKICHLPNRKRISDLIRHAYLFGKHSIKANPSYWEHLNTPFLLRYRTLTLLSSPLLALGLLFKMVVLERLPAKYWHTLPIVFFLKVIWCMGYFNNLFFEVRKNQKIERS